MASQTADRRLAGRTHRDPERLVLCGCAYRPCSRGPCAAMTMPVTERRAVLLMGLLLLRSGAPRPAGTACRSGLRASSPGHRRTRARVPGATGSGMCRSVTGPSVASVPSAARSAIAPDGLGAELERRRSMVAPRPSGPLLVTGPRNRWAAAASSRSASAPSSAAAATPSPSLQAEEERLQGTAHDGRVLRRRGTTSGRCPRTA